jgi:hypothetical protein
MTTASLDQPSATPAHPVADARVPQLLQHLRNMLAKNRRRWRALIALEALALAVALPLAYLWLAFFVDAQLHLGPLARLVVSLGIIAGVLWATRHLRRRWQQLRLTEDEVALAIERRTPGRLHNRLINAVQLARITPGGETRRLSDAVIEENYQRLQQIQLEQAAQLKPALARAALAVGVVGIGLAFWMWEPARFANSAARILLPLAPIDPLYRTRLHVEPGDAEASGDLVLTIAIDGERPASLTILRRTQGKVSAEIVAVDAGDASVTHTFRDVNQRFDYAVRGGDFATRYFAVTVPQKIGLARVRATYHYPAYTGLAMQTTESTAGELEALQGTRVEAVFVLDQPADALALLLDRPGKGQTETRTLARSSDGREFTGEIEFDQVYAYRLEVTLGQRSPQKLGPYPVRVVKDQEPKLELSGLERRTDVQVDSIVPLKIKASDDFGLVTVGLFVRRVLGIAGKEEPWQPVATWDAGKKTRFARDHELAVATLNVAEGEKVELALRALDTDPARNGAWTTGAIYELSVGGDGATLQRQYEQILRSEAELRGLIVAEQTQLGHVVDWLKKLDRQGDLRWDDPKNIDMLHQAVQKLAGDQAGVQKLAGQTVQAMLPQAGNVRIGLGLLADSEMVRAQRILDSVPGREQAAAKRAAVADARVTVERIVRSLQDLAEQYASFRADWEMANMIPFTKMLAERQTRMRDHSQQLAAVPAKAAETFHRQSMERRQTKVLDLCKLIAPAFSNLSERLKEQDAELASACAAGGATLARADLHQPMQQAAAAAVAGQWSDVARYQSTAAVALTDLHDRLRAAQLKAAQKALAALKEKAKSELAAQKELEKLQPGSSENFVKDFPDGFKLEDTVRIWEVAGRKKAPGDGKEEPDFKKSQLADFYDKARIELKEDSGVRQDTSTLTLGKVAEKTAPLPFIPTNKEKNKVKPFIQEQFDDLVGKLLEEADELHKNYQSLNLSTNQNNNDPGDIGKQGGALNSTGAVAATGNKKPPTLESGGVSRTGRQGARAYGMVADEETFNRKGRDQALEGQGEVADQAGKNKMHKTDENQTDFSTGVGGKKIESEDSHFSLHDAGKWKDEYAKRMENPQKKEYIVERQGDKFDAKMAAQLRDLTSKQEQVIERLKSIKKELKNLYLPTEHLDELAAALAAHLENLKERPDAELFRLQLQTLDRLRGSLRLFQNAGASFQPSLPRERVIRGRVLDEPNRPALPGYEEAVRQYYLKLSTK